MDPPKTSLTVSITLKYKEKRKLKDKNNIKPRKNKEILF